jgi:hypothetical protein
MTIEIPNYINHIALVLDESSSMWQHREDLIKVVDNQISHLAASSQERDQETRVSVYTFASTVRCRIFDKDVLRLPSIADLYHPNGRTALVDATILSQRELAQTAQLHGDHAFLTFVMTDGAENESRATGRDLRQCLAGLPAHWTVACLVPDAYGKHEAQSFGFSPDNIAIWNPNGARGVEEAGSVIREATEGFMRGRGQGVRGTRALFSTGADAVNATTVQAALTPLRSNAYRVLPVRHEDYIRPFVEAHQLSYTPGDGYYQLTKTETIQSRKKIVIREKRTGLIYAGPQARDLLGLPNMDVRVKPDYNPEYDVFAQSTSVNRKLVPGTDLLLLS